MSADVATITLTEANAPHHHEHKGIHPWRSIKSVLLLRRHSSRKSRRESTILEKSAVEPVTTSVLPPSAAASEQDEEEEQEPEVDDGASFHLPSATQTPLVGVATPAFVIDNEKKGIAALIAQYGSSSSTSWLEFSRYKIWRPTVAVPESSFVPVQGYLRNDPYVFAWGNPLVSDKSALAPTAAAFWNWTRSQKLKLVWCGADEDLEAVLGKDPRFNWAALTCIVEDVLDPNTVVELANQDGNNGASEVKDFKKNLRRAERENVTIREMRWLDWTPEQKKEVEDGILAWKKAKAKSGLQLASTSFMPWLDSEHRRYFIAEHEGHVVGILILTQIHKDQYQIKNQAMFPGAPRGTSEWLVSNAMQILADESADSAHPNNKKAYVTFGITANASLTPIDNLSGWKISWLTTTYNKVVGSTGLTRRGDFRSKFHTEHEPMYVCYPAKQGFGLDGVSKLIKSLRQ